MQGRNILRRLGMAAAVLSTFSLVVHAQQFTCVNAKQGFSMRLMITNKGDFGRVAYHPCRTSGVTTGLPADSLGLEYPIGARVEHVFGGGLWIGGLLDTSSAGNQPPVKLVSVTYEGWSGPHYEFFPGNTPADTIWKATRHDTSPPPGWETYWGSSLPFRPISDQDFYCTYTDTTFRPTGHIPMGLKIIQSSYAWNDPYAEAIIIFEYKIINVGRKPITEAYIGYFFEADVGPINLPNYWQRNFSEYIAGSRTAYSHNPSDAGSTPVGAVLLQTPIHLDSLRYTFRNFSGPTTPPTDAGKYDFLSSQIQDSSQFPALVDTRFVFAFGPFTVNPETATTPGDTLKIAVAVISGFSRRIDHRVILQRNAARALDIYLNQGIKLPATPPSPPLQARLGFRRLDLSWQWQPGSFFTDPEVNWDTTNQVARRDSLRYVSGNQWVWLANGDSIQKNFQVPPGIDQGRGGRNFEAYRVWRTEDPSLRDESWTLLAQYDVKVPSGHPDSLSFEYDTGLQYTYTDSNLVRGKYYAYSVTSKSIPNLAYQVVQVGDSTFEVPVPVEPLESSKQTLTPDGRPYNFVTIELPFAVSTEVNKVRVVPNPYRTDRVYTLESGGYEGSSSIWDEGRRKIKFINLPEVCVIRVFSLSGDLVRTLHHDGREGTGFSRGDHDMLLVSESNRALASGVYIFTVESDLGSQVGKFVIIR